MHSDPIAKARIGAPRVLMLTSRYPWPLTSGFAIKNYWLLRSLSEEFEVTLCVVRSPVVDERARSEVMKYASTVVELNPGRVDLVFCLFRSLLSGNPFQFALYDGTAVRREVRRIAGDVDAVVVSVIRTLPLVLGSSQNVFVDMADSLGQAYLRNARSATRMLSRWFYRIEGPRLLAYEEMMLAEVRCAFMFNAEEARRFGGRGTVKVVPHGVDQRLFEVRQSASDFSDGVVIFGRMSYAPNVDAVMWFAREVMPRLPDHVKLYAVGADPSTELKELSRAFPRVVVTGFIEDPYPGIRGALASICPIRLGGGIQNKVLESMAVGALTIVSPLAAEAIPDCERWGVQVCRSVDEWCSAITRVIESGGNNQELRLLAREYAERHCSWGAYGRAVLEEIHTAVPSKRMPSSVGA